MAFASLAEATRQQPNLRRSEAEPGLAEVGKPVRLLREMNISVTAAWTQYLTPPFIMLYTDPTADVDVSHSMHEHRVVEPLYQAYWSRLTEACCAKGGLVLDGGANFGYYALLAAKHGCRVVAWEPVPAFRAFLRAAAALNNLSHMLHVRPTALSAEDGADISITVPSRGIWGTASVDGGNIDPSIPSSYEKINLRTETMDAVLGRAGALRGAAEPACGMKLDVEGWEPQVVKGARRLLARRPPRVLLTEYSPGVVERRGREESARQPMLDYPASLRTFSRAGYDIWHLPSVTKSSVPLAVRASGSKSKSPLGPPPLPPLKRVTAAAIAAEEVNARNYVAHRNFGMPWDLHPRSLHADFTHNTDLLLAINASPATLPSLGEVGVWQDSRHGLGGAPCSFLDFVTERLGRLCVMENRTERIAAAAAAADALAAQPLATLRSVHVVREAKRWELQGNTLVKKACKGHAPDPPYPI